MKSGEIKVKISPSISTEEDEGGSFNIKGSPDDVVLLAQTFLGKNRFNIKCTMLDDKGEKKDGPPENKESD